MGWSPRQVWGFTGLMLGVIVMSIVGMVTMVLFLMMGPIPEGNLILITTPTTTPTAPPPISCDPTPEDAFVFLPDHCAILSSSPSLSPSLEILPYFNMKRCSNHMCTPDSCHGDRCCCQAVQSSSLSYRCPNDRVILVPNIVEKCGCTPCANIPVVFVGMVTDTENAAIPHATVLVDHRHTYTTNEEAIFGFAVASTQEKVVVMVMAVGFWRRTQTLTVMPGEVNVLQVSLLREVRSSFPPVLAAVLVNVFDLAVHPLTSPPTVLPEGGGATGESFIEFPEGMFLEPTTLIGRQVDVGNAASLQSLGMSFVALTSEDSARGRRVKRGMEWRLGEGVENNGKRGRERRGDVMVGGGKQRVRRSDDVTEEMVFVVRVGVLDIVGGEGERVAGNISGLVVHAYFPKESYACSDVPPLQLYLQTHEGLSRAQGGNLSCTTEEGLSHVQGPLPPDTSLPITYLLGVAEEVGETCHVAVRAFEPTSMGNLTEMETSVWLLTKNSGNLEMANVMFGQTRECVPIPCRGEMVIQILDGLKYTPDSYTVMLSDDDIIINSDGVIEEGEIYKDRSECEKMALGADAEEFTYFQFLVLPRLPALVALPTPADANFTTPPFCSLRIGVRVPVGVANVHVTAYSTSSDGSMVRVGRVGSGGGGGDGEDVGSGACEECEETYVTCLQVSCDYQVGLTVSSVSGDEERLVCVPVVMVGGGGEGMVVEGGKVTLGQGAKPKGFVVDLVGPDPSIAMEMCKLGTETDVWFHCFT